MEAHGSVWEDECEETSSGLSRNKQLLALTQPLNPCLWEMRQKELLGTFIKGAWTVTLEKETFPVGMKLMLAGAEVHELRRK